MRKDINLEEIDLENMSEDERVNLLKALSLPEDVTEELIEKWKTEFANCEIYTIRFSEKEAFVFRTLTRFEYKQLLKSISSASFQTAQEMEMYNEETIVERCILYPKINRADMEGMKAGTITVLAEAIMNASGFNPMGGPVRL